MNVNARFGTSFKINKDLKIQPYGFVGFNLSDYRYMNVPENNTNDNAVQDTYRLITNEEEAREAEKHNRISKTVNDLVNINYAGATGGAGFALENPLVFSYPVNHTDTFTGISYSYTKDEALNGAIGVKTILNRAGINFNDNFFHEYKGEDGNVIAYYYVDPSYTATRLLTRNEYINYWATILGAPGETDAEKEARALEMIERHDLHFDYNSLIGMYYNGDDDYTTVENFITADEYNAWKETLPSSVNNAGNRAINNDVPKNQLKIGLNAGAGVDFVIKNRFIVGLEYRYSEINFDLLKVQTHNVGVKFGVNFL